ncbi:MAG: aspartate carbamoyltransferase catalytic subunit [Candidatus Marinimicrobia bacterium]|nr:aspartate carbamoyltransferase catalytic subunit [Candidatus Neomarinimicrobiota bacterium]
MAGLSGRHLLGLEGVPKSDIQLILDTAFTFREVLDRPVPKVPTLQGQTVLNFFYEPSTRTRMSFELAEKRLSADSINFSKSGSSASKGETLRDTIRNIEAMKVDTVVIRHSAPGAAKLMTEFVDSNVINAGDGRHEHPTQALLDMMTLQENLKSIEGLKVAIIGDILHSRVARSNIIGLKTMGAEVMICGPKTLLPYRAEALGVEVSTDINEALEFADVLSVLRVQLERQKGGLFPSLREYRKFFGITMERLNSYSKKFTIMHPGPINRGVEMDSDVADSEHSVILNQVTNGVAVRMAVLVLLTEAGKKSKKN